MVKIAPSILSADFSRLGEEIKAAEKAGADLIHVDIMDGHFVPNITIGPPVVKSIKKIASIPLDVHLMIEGPDKYVRPFADSGADIITVHEEASVHLHRTVHIEFILPFVDMVLIMSVNPGFGGQRFIPEVLSKIKMLKNIINEQKINVDIEVDGGINVNNVTEVVSAGAEIVVMGNAFYNSKDYAETVKIVRERCR